MRTLTRWLACLLVGGLFLTPTTVHGPDYNIGDPTFEIWLPLMWGEKDEGFYASGEFMLLRMNNPLRSQIIAVRGFFDDNGVIRGSGSPYIIINQNGQLVSQLIPPDEVTVLEDGSVVIDEDFLLLLGNTPFFGPFFSSPGTPGQFIGTKAPALTAGQVGKDKFEPGFRFTIGYRLRNNIAIEFSFWRVSDYEHRASAGILPPGSVGFAPGTVPFRFADSFLTAPFYNFPIFYAGPERDVVGDFKPFLEPLSPQDIADLNQFNGFVKNAFGIWNAAEDMTMQFWQRALSAELTFRLPVMQTECARTTMFMGPRYIYVLEHFRLRTVDQDLDGNISPLDTAYYDNEWRNMLYGGQIGMSHERYLGQGFACSIDGRVGLFADYRKTRVKVQRGDIEELAVQRTRDDLGVSPMFQLGAYLWYYPFEGVQMRIGYEFLGIFNVRRSEQPVAFNVGQLDPEFKDIFLRFDGLVMGVALIF